MKKIVNLSKLVSANTEKFNSYDTTETVNSKDNAVKEELTVKINEISNTVSALETKHNTDNEAVLKEVSDSENRVKGITDAISSD